MKEIIGKKLRTLLTGAAVSAAAALLCTLPAGAQFMNDPGDVNCDGATDYLDVDAMISMINKERELSKQGKLNADITGDGLVTYEDLDLLISIINGEYVPKKTEEIALPTDESQVVNETPATYSSLGVSRDDKDAFEEKIKSETKLPAINITTKDNSELILSRDIYTSCVVDVFNAGEKFELDEVSAGIRVRGNSSAFYGDVEKIKQNTVPYRIKFDKKTNMLGLNDGAKCKSWVLLKSDWDLVRNDIALRFGRTIFGDDAYCSDAKLVDLYVNDKLQGVYLLCEQNQVNKNRVNVSEPEENYTGKDFGFYLELDNYAWEDPDNQYVNMRYGGAYCTDITGVRRKFESAAYSIKNDIYTQAQKDFISKYLNNIFSIVYRACERGEYYTFDKNYDLVKADFTSAEETLAAVMDLDSAVDMYLLYEIVHDYDCGEGSFYLCVDFDKDSKINKLQFTSPWDFNWAYNDSTERYWAGAFCEQSFADSFGDRSNPWFIVLAKQDWFRQRASEKWQALNGQGAIRACIDEEKAILETYREDLNRPADGAVDAAYSLLDGWLTQRLDWMDRTFKSEQ
ncbi:MAG: CotH kinase family protein [Ruminococcus sp.]|nr:CotH kinase family protein [Ruminococcus sp.]